MTDHNPDVAAVLGNWTHFGLCPAWCQDRNSGAHSHNFLDALTAAGIACVYVPEGVEVAHGARLVASVLPAHPVLYHIEPPEKGGACYCGPNGGPHWHTEGTP